MKKRMMMLSVILFMLGLPLAFADGGTWAVDNLSHDAPGATLLAPCTDNFDLKGKAELAFRWMPSQGAKIYHYDFKVFRGFQTSQENLIIHEVTKVFVRSISVPADKFEPGQVYTWVLTGILYNGWKTDSSSCSFNIK